MAQGETLTPEKFQEVYNVSSEQGVIISRAKKVFNGSTVGPFLDRVVGLGEEMDRAAVAQGLDPDGRYTVIVDTTNVALDGNSLVDIASSALVALQHPLYPRIGRSLVVVPATSGLMKLAMEGVRKAETMGIPLGIYATLDEALDSTRVK